MPNNTISNKWTATRDFSPDTSALLQAAMADATRPGKSDHEPPRCRCCASPRLWSRGRLPDAQIFAGARLDHPLPGGILYRCGDCGFVFRAPIFSKQAYDALYRAGDSTTWEEEQRKDHALVREALCAHLASGDILDVGCSGGSLLMPLVGRYSTFGAEINLEAAHIAETRGIHIVAHDMDEVAQLPRTFDAVVSCDVIEHLANPLEFMQMLLAKTSGKGLVIVSSGNPAAWSWQLFGSRFWYCYLPEHLSFVSPAWFEHFADYLGVDIVQTRRFVYSPDFPWHGKALRLALMALFRLSPKLYYRLLPPAKRHNIPVGRGITRDHFVIVLRKRAKNRSEP